MSGAEGSSPHDVGWLLVVGEEGRGAWRGRSDMGRGASLLGAMEVKRKQAPEGGLFLSYYVLTIFDGWSKTTYYPRYLTLDPHLSSNARSTSLAT